MEEALAAGNAVLAAQIAALKRPTLSAWASNLLVHSEPQQVARMLRLGERLRQPHRNLNRAQLRRMSRQRSTLVDALSQQARSLAAEAGHPIGQAAQRKVEQTLQSALADPSASEQWASGRLVKALAPPTSLTAATAAVDEACARSAAAPHQARAGKPPSKPEVPETKSVRKQRRADEASRKPAQAQREAEAAEQRARRREEEHDQAQAEVERAEAALRELQQRATRLAQQLHATVELRRRVRNDLDDARRRAAQTDHTARKARHVAETARTHAERLTTRGSRSPAGQR
ncbi:hypothetical protein [Streptomyces sp. NRRL S-813]|uniref:hypothetical protein n=1 Tax=Streptomyces sp. NRRL S-813 TaxID=1463919 RepID=UPI00131C498C|nr:hypothetical protein [Streptomyces sp. NRRL S-813]